MTLTPNEADALERLARGELVREIAAAWHRTGTVVYRTLTTASQALGAQTYYEAVSIWTAMRSRRDTDSNAGGDA